MAKSTTLADSVIVNVCIFPSPEVAKECVKISQAIAAKFDGTMFKLDGKTKFPHMTVFMFRIPKTSKEQICRVVGEVVHKTKSFLCEATGFYATPGRYYEVSYKVTQEFRGLQNAMAMALKRYRLNPGQPHFEGYFNPDNAGQSQNVMETGYDLIYGDSRPHITETRFEEGKVPAEFLEFDHSVLSFPLSRICVYEADDNGAVHTQLASFEVA